jgi:hypothetical protein
MAACSNQSALRTQRSSIFRLVLKALFLSIRQMLHRGRKDLAEALIRHLARLMFGSHKTEAAFHFFQLTQHSPRHHTAHAIEKVSYRAKDVDKIVKKGQQIRVYYEEGVTFA